jgi:general secretion pathway protein E
MVEESFNQMQVNHAIDLDFSRGVRTLMRQDPDIIMIGEIRDLETAQMAIQAALTGHLVLSSLHTNDSPSSISRLLELGAPAYLVKATLRGVMSQRLVRVLCEACKRPAAPDPEGWRELVRPFDVPMPGTLYEPVGCKACRDSGFLGRRGIYEVLVNTPAIQEEIVTRINTARLRDIATGEGMNSLRVSGATRIARGETTIEEVMRVAPALAP